MTMPQDVTLGELWRNIESLRTEANRRFDDLNATLSNKVLTVDLYTIAHAEVVNDVKDLKEDRIRDQGFRRNITVAVLGALGSGTAALIVELARMHH